jgi:hypothetical protein
LDDRREGIINGTDLFRVYVQFEDYEYRDKDVLKKINDKILSDSAVRFSDLINASALQCLNREDRDALELFTKKKDLIGQINYKKIGDEEVFAFVDFQLPKQIVEILSVNQKKQATSIKDE